MIERLYVNNFRCLENFSIDFGPRPSTLLIGKNGTGKSTVRHALAVFQSICRGSGRVRELIERTDFAQHRTHIPIRFEVDLKLDAKDFKYWIAFDWPENFREARIIEEGLAIGSDPVFSREKAQVTMAGGTTFRLDWHVVALPIINDRAEEQHLRKVKQFFSSMLLLAPNPAGVSGFSEGDTFELRQDAGNFSSSLNALLSQYPAAYSVMIDYLRFVIPDLESIENVLRGERGKQLIVRFEQGDPPGALSIEFEHLSDGEKAFFFSALIIAWNQVKGPVFCFWDEPDNHLSLPEVGHFITRLRKLVNRNGQFIATSHHPETIRRFSDENTLVTTRKSHLEPTVVRTLEDFSYDGDLIGALLRGEVIE
jgi:predicted ATPase